MPSFGKGGGSRNSHEMRLSGMPGMDLLISPSLQTYTANEPNESLKLHPRYSWCLYWPMI